MRWLVTLHLAVLAVLGAPGPAADAAPPIHLVPVLSGLSSPTFVTNARDGSDRLFIVEQAGIIKVLRPGQSTPAVFLNLTAKVLSGGERGLLGLTFHPQFAANGRFIVSYTRKPDGAVTIAEYAVSSGDPNVADPAETVHLVIPKPFANHNGGMVEFGPDDYLYISTGDGGSGNDPNNRGQEITSLLGKILRIDVDTPSQSRTYSAPPSNPFFGALTGADEIYAFGLRNPWRFSFDRETGDLYVGDVGQGAIEEIDLIGLGDNAGWRVWEGTRCTSLDPGLCDPQDYVFPITEYGHAGGRCSVTGGYVYRGTRASLPAGSYVYADFCTGEIFVLESGAVSIALDTALKVSSFGEDESGEIYVVGHGGTVHRIVAAPRVTAVTPAQGMQGTSVAVTIDGTAFADGATVHVGAAVAAANVTRVSPTRLTATLAIGITAVAGARDVTVTNPDGSTGTRASGFSIVPAQPPTLTVAYRGKERDRAGTSTTALGPDGGLDAGLTVTVRGSMGRALTGLQLQSNAGGVWDTVSATTHWVLGVARGLDDALLNAPGTMAIAVPLADGQSVTLFAADWQNTLFLPGRVLTVTATFAGGVTATATATVPPPPPPPPPPTLTVTYRGKERDRAGTSTTALGPDGGLDAGLTVTVRGSMGRALTGLQLQSNAGGVWDTVSATTHWVLGVARGLDDTLLNAPGTMAIAVPLGDGESVTLFAADWQNAQFLPGRVLTVTATFAGGVTVTATTTVPPPPPPPPPPTLTVAYRGKERDRVGTSNTALGPDGGLDAGLTVTVRGSAGRALTGLQLQSNAGGVWDTVSATTHWVLGVARGLDDALLNAPGTMAIAVPLADGQSVTLFAADWQNTLFLPGRVLTVTATFAGGVTVTAATTVP